MPSSPLPEKMRAILIKGGSGPSDALYLGEADVPKPGPGDVIVKIKAAGINRMDLLQRQGQYPLPPGASTIMGVEFSGTIADANGSQWKEGDAVFGLATGGAYAEFVRVPSQMVLAKPQQLSWEQAAAIPENFLTAFQALKTISDLQEGQDVLIHAGASGVGLAAIQLAKAFGARNVFVTAGTAEKVAFCESMGATKGINYKAADWADELKQLTDGKGVNIVMDFVGAPYFAQNLASLAQDGRLVLQGLMGGLEVPKANIGPLLFKRLRVEGSTLRSRSLEYQSRLMQDFLKSGGLERLVREEKDGKHHLVIHKVYPWTEIKAAHDEMAANKNTGKIIITIE